MIFSPRLAAIAAMAGMSAACPPKCTGMMASVRGVISASICGGLMQQVS